MRRVTVVGVGALGSHAALFLRSADVQLRLIDFDRVEQKNVLSQFHGRQSVGKLKAQALAQSLNFMFGTKAEALTVRLDQRNVKELLSGSDLVLDCLDNGASRRTVQQHVRGAGIECLHGAVDAEGSFGRVIWDEGFAVDDESAAGAATCEDGANLPFIVQVSSAMARAAQRFLLEGRKAGWLISPGGTVPV